MQPTLAKSSMEAEYMALCYGTYEILGLDMMLQHSSCIGHYWSF